MRNILGKNGEEIALRHLESKGYEKVKVNYRYARAEIDIIARRTDHKIIVFAEVKTRKSTEFADASDSITEIKQNQILKAAEGFLSVNEEYEDFEKRFDVISVYMDGRSPRIEHLEDVF